MELAYAIFGRDAFRKRLHSDDQRKPINKALFEVLSVSFSKLTEEERDKLRSNIENFKLKFIALHNQSDGKFLRSISQGTAQKETVEQRFKDIGNLIKECIEL